MPQLGIMTWKQFNQSCTHIEATKASLKTAPAVVKSLVLQSPALIWCRLVARNLNNQTSYE